MVCNFFFRICGNNNPSEMLIKSSHKDRNISTCLFVLAAVVVTSVSFDILQTCMPYAVKSLAFVDAIGVSGHLMCNHQLVSEGWSCIMLTH